MSPSVFWLFWGLVFQAKWVSEIYTVIHFYITLATSSEGRVWLGSLHFERLGEWCVCGSWGHPCKNESTVFSVSEYWPSLFKQPMTNNKKKLKINNIRKLENYFDLLYCFISDLPNWPNFPLSTLTCNKNLKYLSVSNKMMKSKSFQLLRVPLFKEVIILFVTLHYRIPPTNASVKILNTSILFEGTVDGTIKWM